MSLITKLAVSGFIRGKRYASNYSYPNGMNTQEYIDRLAAHRRAFEAPYEFVVTMYEPE